MAQALANFAGFPIYGGTFTVSPGGHPSIAVISTPAQSVSQSAIGPLTLSYGPTSLTFPNCAVLRGSQYYLDHGARMMRHRVVDSRWRWTKRSIGGKYNTRRADNQINSADRKTLGELFQILMDAAGETYTIGSLPASYYSVDWSAGTTLSNAVDELCYRSGCSVAPNGQGGYAIYGPGQGPQLPGGGATSNASSNLGYSAKPDKVQVQMADTIYQSNLRLRAVGVETDGSLRRLIDLSYRPFLGWGSIHPETFAGLTGSAYYLARGSVYRFYQIESQSYGGLQPPNYQGTVNSVAQYTLQDELITSADDWATDFPIANRPSIVGAYLTENLVRENTSISTPYQGGFVIHKDRLLVEFERPVYKSTAGQPDEADLFLKIAYRVRKDSTWEHDAHIYEQQLSGGDQVEVVRRPDLQRWVVQSYSTSDPRVPASVTDNQGSVDSEAAQQIQQIANQVSQDGNDIVYDGIVNALPSGVIAQVRFDFGYEEPALTRASTRADFDLYAPNSASRASRMAVGLLSEGTLKL